MVEFYSALVNECPLIKESSVSLAVLNMIVGVDKFAGRKTTIHIQLECSLIDKR